MVLDTGDKKYLIIGADYSLEYEQTPEMLALWSKLFDEYMLKHGKTKEYEEWMKLRMRLNDMRNDYLIEQNRIKLNFIKRVEKELEVYEKRMSQDKNKSVLSSVSRRVGYHLKSKEVTVNEVYSYIKDIKND